MPEVWLTLKDVPADGREFSFSDQSLWTDAWREFNLPYAVKRPLEASLFVLPQKDGALVRGSISGAISLPCDRCAEDMELPVEESFEVYEQLDGEDADVREDGWLRQVGDHLELNVGGLLWEQFLLGLPVKPLCSPACQGLCPGCGQNLNLGPCQCEQEQSDPRLAVLRDLKLTKKQ